MTTGTGTIAWLALGTLVAAGCGPTTSTGGSAGSRAGAGGQTETGGPAAGGSGIGGQAGAGGTPGTGGSSGITSCNSVAGIAVPALHVVPTTNEGGSQTEFAANAAAPVPGTYQLTSVDTYNRVDLGYTPNETWVFTDGHVEVVAWEDNVSMRTTRNYSADFTISDASGGSVMRLTYTCDTCLTSYGGQFSPCSVAVGSQTVYDIATVGALIYLQDNHAQDQESRVLTKL